MKKEKRIKRTLGRAKILPLSEGWRYGDPGYIIPTMGYWKDRSIAIGSKFAELLGWPEACREKLQLTIEYPDGTVVHEDGTVTKKNEKNLIPEYLPLSQEASQALKKGLESALTEPIVYDADNDLQFLLKNN